MRIAAQRRVVFQSSRAASRAGRRRAVARNAPGLLHVAGIDRSLNDYRIRRGLTDILRLDDLRCGQDKYQ